jgi:hypothetical protein
MEWEKPLLLKSLQTKFSPLQEAFRPTQILVISHKKSAFELLLPLKDTSKTLWNSEKITRSWKRSNKSDFKILNSKGDFPT